MVKNRLSDNGSDTISKLLFTLEKTKGVIKHEQSKETGKTWYTRGKQTK
jgi:hypothetical protein